MEREGIIRYVKQLNEQNEEMKKVVSLLQSLVYKQEKRLNDLKWSLGIQEEGQSRIPSLREQILSRLENEEKWMCADLDFSIRFMIFGYGDRLTEPIELHVTEIDWLNKCLKFQNSSDNMPLAEKRLKAWYSCVCFKKRDGDPCAPWALLHSEILGRRFTLYNVFPEYMDFKRKYPFHNYMEGIFSFDLHEDVPHLENIDGKDGTAG